MNTYLPWTVDTVQNMAGMFNNCNKFKGRGLEQWNVENVEFMNYMFYANYNLSPDLSHWNTRRLEQMEYMFYLASGFNGNISNWKVGSVKNMDHSFADAKSFNQNLCQWGGQLPNDVKINQVFAGSGCTNATDPITLVDGPWCQEC